MLAASTIYGIVFVVTVTFAVTFRRQQNKKTLSGEWVGGEISWPKAFWLAWAIAAWFLLPLSFLLMPALPLSLRYVLIGHLLSWWIRGPLEMVMIYKWFNWTPIYGISHDAIHNWVLTAALVWAVGTIGWNAVLANPAALLTTAFILVVIFSLMAEMVFAALFITTRGKGEHKIYFASDDPIYLMINRMTAAVCAVVYALTVAIGVGMVCYGF